MSITLTENRLKQRGGWSHFPELVAPQTEATRRPDVIHKCASGSVQTSQTWRREMKFTLCLISFVSHFTFTSGRGCEGPVEGRVGAALQRLQGRPGARFFQLPDDGRNDDDLLALREGFWLIPSSVLRNVPRTLMTPTLSWNL